MPEIQFDRYYRYAELSALLQAYVAEYPGLVQLTSIGKSHEGRDVWLVSVTDETTGPASEKPAFWCDATIHATELSPGTAVLYLLNKLCTQFRSDPTITEALKTRAFYLVPRVSPDGAEWAMETPPRTVRSSTRPWPFADEDVEGLEKSDIDGDGRILNMRIEDPNGGWKISPEEPRLLVRRNPEETGGTYYRVMPEGLFHNFDGLTLRGRRVTEGLDFNRNFPSAWRPEQEQFGAGPYPTSEPEIRNLVQAIVDRPNITGAIAFHTFSGVHLRPPSRYPDDEMPPEDLWVFNTFGAKGTEMTGYPAISNFHEFKYHPKEVITGVFDDWMYEQRGVFAWTTEIWSPQREAGITDYKYIDWFREHPFEHDRLLLQWSDEELDGKGHIDWYPFEHPQLGKVELGGWDAIHAFRNPPPQFLEAEVAPFADWVVYLASCSPRLVHHKTLVSGYSVRVAVQNAGYLPTNVTKGAATKKLCRGVIAEIRRKGEDWGGKGSARPMWLLAGKLRMEAGQLVGRNHITAGGFGWQMNGTEDMAVFEWSLAPGEYEVVVRHERAGVVRTEFSVARAAKGDA